MKKFIIVLLVLLMLASCFVFTSCQSRCDKRGYHEFYPEDTCRICKKTRCQVGEHDWNGNRCDNCGTTKCQAGEHRWYQDEICYDCGASRCEEGEHVYFSGVCRWCEKSVCQIEGHNWYKGTCRGCGRDNFFALFFPTQMPNQSGSQTGNQQNNDFWDKVGQGALTVAFMLVVTAIASVIYWLGCMFGWGWLTWVGHAVMLFIAIGMFLTYHWIWGVVFFVVFGGAYLGIVCPLITKHYYGYDKVIY